MPTSKAQLEATKKYARKTYKDYRLRVRKEEKHIIDHMEKQQSKNDYLKKLVEKDIKESRKNN